MSIGYMRIGIAVIPSGLLQASEVFAFCGVMLCPVVKWPQWCSVVSCGDLWSIGLSGILCCPVMFCGVLWSRGLSGVLWCPLVFCGVLWSSGLSGVL